MDLFQIPGETPREDHCSLDISQLIKQQCIQIQPQLWLASIHDPIKIKSENITGKKERMNTLENEKMIVLKRIPAHLQQQIHLQLKFLQYPLQLTRSQSCRAQLGLPATGYLANDLCHKIIPLPPAQTPSQYQISELKFQTSGLLYC